MKQYYTGVGTRQLPKELEERVVYFAEGMVNSGFTLRSGGADGNDSIHEKVYLQHKGNKEIYLPWNGFNGRYHNPAEGYFSIGNQYKLIQEAAIIAMRHISHWDNLTQGAKKLHTRNVLQVLGADLNTPSEILVYCTANGVLTGGTRTAVTIAKAFGIPTLDLFHYPI